MARTKSFHGEVELPQHDDEKENWLKFYVNPYSGQLQRSSVSATP
jgi:hypothetical protein